jgi:hypothetical protein
MNPKPSVEKLSTLPLHHGNSAIYFRELESTQLYFASFETILAGTKNTLGKSSWPLAQGPVALQSFSLFFPLESCVLQFLPVAEYLLHTFISYNPSMDRLLQRHIYYYTMHHPMVMSMLLLFYCSGLGT